jgi:hypothetical protein
MTKRTPNNHEPVQPPVNDQSGSTGRDTGPPSNNPGVDGKPGTGANTGQGTYGQSGYGQGGFGKGNGVPASHEKDAPGRADPRAKKSNPGSGLPDPAKDEQKEK